MPAQLLASIAPLSSARRAPATVPLGWIVAFAAAVTCILVIAHVSYTSIASNRERAMQVAKSLEIIERAQTLLSGLKDAETGQRGFLLTGSESYLDPYITARSAQEAREQRLRELLADNRRQLDRLETVSNLAEQKYAELQQTIELRRQGRTDEAQARVRSDQGKAAMDRLRQIVANLVTEEQGRLDQRQAAWLDGVSTATTASLTGSAVLTVLVLTVAALAVREHRRREDELWVRRSNNTLAHGLQGDLDEASLATKSLAVLGHALQAQVGALYVVEADRTLRRAGVVGGDARELPQRLAADEGWLAQAARDGLPMHLTDVPAGHLRVHTATGHSDPAELLVVPVKYEGATLGVLELGFFGEAGPVAPAFAERVAALMGAAMHSAQRRRDLEQLLEETQRQAEELQAQQEELRVSNEELEERGRVLRESQAELEAQRAELERVNGALMQHTHMLEQQRAQLLATQAELKGNAQALEAASRYKSEFLANMSHELRTPLNSSLILSRLLIDNKGGTLSDEQVRYARAIHDSNNELLALINDILDLSKIEAGHADLRAENVVLSELLARQRALFEPQAQAKGLDFTIEVDAEVPAVVQTDGQRLAQVLKNLLANAVKFTARGRVALALRPAAGGGVRFEVRDTGIGIAADKLQVIFEAFRQADGSTSRQFGGTGLGLSISRELVQRMGGQIGVASTPGEGSTFTVELPLQMPAAAPVPTPVPAVERAALPPASPPAPAPMMPAPAAAPPVPRPDGSRRVLLAVEDDSAFADVLRTIVAEAGFDCVVANDGEAALQLARELEPAGVLLDVGLPDVSGLSVLERLKRDSATRHIPVHIVSAADRMVPALEMGAIGHVVKPIQRDELLQVIERLRERAEHGPRRLLIVEDDATLRQNLSLLLAGPDVVIDAAGTVAEAEAALAAQAYDCIVTDLALPDATGFELLERLAGQGAAEGGPPPVIVYTGRTLTRDEETQLRRYSRSIIVKGARSPERLLDEVTLFLHSVESRLPGEQQRMLRVARERDTVLDGRRILLAEDDVRNIFALTSAFEPLGVRVEVARNGREAVERLQARADIDLVLMDVMMPEMDGLAAMRLIRQQPQWKDLPIIALTAKAMADDRRQCLDAGANDYLAKPIDIDRLVSLCRVWMPK